MAAGDHNADATDAGLLGDTENATLIGSVDTGAFGAFPIKGTKVN